jgi:hypothetical protein
VLGEQRRGERLHHGDEGVGGLLGGGCTAARERPLASTAAWRASAIDGSVSPTVLNSL